MENKTKQRGIEESVDRELKLTLGESLFTHRRRNDWTQMRAAKKWKLSLFLYKMMEYDKFVPKGFYVSQIENLTDNEKCTIYRRRSKYSQQEIANLAGVSRFWLNQMETGRVACQKLLKFWEINGWTNSPVR